MITLALTPGEPAGIGPDLTVALAGQRRRCRLVAIADPQVLEARARLLGRSLRCVPYDPAAAGEYDPGILEVEAVVAPAAVEPGVLDPANGRYVLDTLRRAARGCLDGRFDALVTAPVSKAVINDAGVPFSGHTEFLAEISGAALPVMMLAAGTLRVALATTHLPLRHVPDAITGERLAAVCRVLDADLRTRFGVARPRVLVAGLNPHAGEDGHLGREEIDVIAPTLERLRGEGLDLVGPLPADTLYTPAQLEGADATLAMYHDQGLPVLKYAGFGHAVNITLGLPIIRTSVDHGTALDLAGAGGAGAGSLEAAVAQAQVLVRAGRGTVR